MAVFFEIGSLNRVIRRVLGTESVASIPFWVVRPSDDLVPVPALENLAVSNVMREL